MSEISPTTSSGPSPDIIRSRNQARLDEVRAFFDALASAGFRAETFFLEANDEYVVDIHCGYSSQGTGAVDTTWA
jgi:hypothetical protein